MEFGEDLVVCSFLVGIGQDDFEVCNFVWKRIFVPFENILINLEVYIFFIYSLRCLTVSDCFEYSL